jgi:L-cysteine:1D-myo-inositol 2-amino-2-deoxy-alpha-D-glucopyranoside ligase
MVGLDGEKMSKSLGNLVLVSGLLEQGHDPMAVRLALLAHHYRSDWSWTGDDLPAAEKRLGGWRDAARHGDGDGSEVVARMRAAMADDLDAPAAVAAVDAWVSGGGGGGRQVAAACDALLGVRL